jgi:hypothetical protein
MAGTKGDNTTVVGWRPISLWDALVLLRQRHPEPLAKERLVRGIAAGDARYCPNNSDIAAAWQQLGGKGDPSARIGFLEIHWEESWLEFYIGGVRRHAYPIQVAQEDVLQLLLESPFIEAESPSVTPTSVMEELQEKRSAEEETGLSPAAATPAPATKKRRLGKQERVIEGLMPELYGEKGPQKGLRPSKLRRDIINLQRTKTPKGKKPPEPPDWDACKRWIVKHGLNAR